MDRATQQAYRHVERLTRKYGTSYYFATQLFPQKMRYATYALYGFFRVPDEYVDNPDGKLGPEEIATTLDQWQAQWEQAYQTQKSDDPVLLVTAQTFHEYQIPYQYSLDFLKAMRQDLTKERYDSYAELQEYMYGSASVVGLMMSHVIGFEEGALPYAEKLGEAMQMTNFLRDIREDYEQRNRIYIPAEHRDQFGVTEEHIKNHICDRSFVNLMKFEIEQTRMLYQMAEDGIAKLHPKGRFPVQMASRLYAAILDKIEQAEYNVFSGRVHTTTWEKMGLLWRERIHK